VFFAVDVICPTRQGLAQLIPAGELETDPAPEPPIRTVSVKLWSQPVNMTTKDRPISNIPFQARALVALMEEPRSRSEVTNRLLGGAQIVSHETSCSQPKS
jgi:hypothetical protein